MGAVLHFQTEPTAPSFRVFSSAQAMLTAVHICFGTWDISPWLLDCAITFFYLMKMCLAVSDASSAFTVLAISCAGNS